MKTDLRAALVAVSKQLHDHGDKGQVVDDLIELADGSPDVQLAVWQSGHSWGPETETGSDVPDSAIMASAPSDCEPKRYEVLGRRASWLKCQAADSSESFKVSLIRRDWVVEEDREKFDRLLKTTPPV